MQWSSITWLATGAAANLLVCVSLVWTFYTSKTTFNEDDGWMTKILMYGVHTGAFTTITTIIDVIFIASWKGTLVSTGLNYSASKIFLDIYCTDLEHIFSSWQIVGILRRSCYVY